MPALLKLAVPVALLMLPATAATTRASTDERPNVLIVMTDDQRADGTLRVMPRTRRLLARAGTSFTDAHVTTPNCCPSRASFFTGLYAHNHGVVDNYESSGRLDHSRTVQRHLQRRGYRTGIFGKYLNGWQGDPPHFDRWSISGGGFERAVWNIDGRTKTLERYTTDLVAKRALRFIRSTERRDAQPWLAWVTPFAPHLPSTPARRHKKAALPRFGWTPALAESDYSDKPSFLDSVRGYPEMIRTARDDGRRSLMAVDEMVGRLMRRLRRQRERRDTLVIFTSDNGFLLGEHGGLAGKNLPYRASTQVPLIVRWPGHVPAGRVNRRFATNLDVATTVLRVAGVRAPTDGTSLLARSARSALFAEEFGTRTLSGSLVVPPWRSLRTRAYRFAEYYGTAGETIAREYYDLRRDPWELENAVARLTSKRLAALSARLEELGRCKRRGCP